MKKHPCRALFLSVLLLKAVLTGPAGAAAESEPAASPEVTAALQPYLDSYKLAGIIGIIADRSGKIHHRNLLGHANVETVKPISEDNVFWIASMTKMVTPGATSVS